MAQPAALPERAPLPVTLLSGFLGAGKTTLVNRILSERHGERIAVVVNEFGDVGIDGRLVVSSADSLVQLANGCVCCTVRGDLQESLKELLAARQRMLIGRRAFDRILIEASGLAAPGPIAQTLQIDPQLRQALRLDGILTLAHAVNLPQQLLEHPEAVQQVAYADRILINHADRADAGQLATCHAAILERNALAVVQESSHGDVPVAPLLEVGTTREARWDLERVETSAHDHKHASDVSSVALRTHAALDLSKLKMWLQFLTNRRSHDLFRLKGILRCVERPEQVIVQGMYEWLELGPGDQAAPEESALVLIGRNLDREELERGWRACLASE